MKQIIMTSFLCLTAFFLFSSIQIAQAEDAVKAPAIDTNVFKEQKKLATERVNQIIAEDQEFKNCITESDSRQALQKCRSNYQKQRQENFQSFQEQKKEFIGKKQERSKKIIDQKDKSSKEEKAKPEAAPAK